MTNAEKQKLRLMEERDIAARDNSTFNVWRAGFAYCTSIPTKRKLKRDRRKRRDAEKKANEKK